MSLSATGVDSIDVSPEAGEAIACTVSAAAGPPPATPTPVDTDQLPLTG